MPSKRQRLFALLIAQHHATLPTVEFLGSGPYGTLYNPRDEYAAFIRAQSNAKPTSTGYPYHLALRQIEGR